MLGNLGEGRLFNLKGISHIMKIRIASFNIEKFSRQSVYCADDAESRKDIKMIAKIIRENNFDIIALQEVFHPEALKYLLRELSYQNPVDVSVSRMGAYTAQIAGFKSDTWEARWAQPKPKFSNMAAEGYAFIWNTKRIGLSRNMKVITSNICFIINNKGSSLGIASKLRLFNIASYSCSNTIRSS